MFSTRIINPFSEDSTAGIIFYNACIGRIGSYYYRNATLYRSMSHNRYNIKDGIYVRLIFLV